MLYERHMEMRPQVIEGLKVILATDFPMLISSMPPASSAKATCPLTPRAGAQAAPVWARLQPKCRRAVLSATSDHLPIAEVISAINATMLGAQTVNPKIKIKIIWANWSLDPGKEAERRQTLLNQVPT